MDLSSAFDTVDRQKLLKTLEAIGVKNRRPYLYNNSSKSDEINFHYDVVKGEHCGSHFILNIHKLHTKTEYCE